MKKRIRTHTNPLNITHRLDALSIESKLTKYASVDFEIGFGRGRFMSQYAQNHGDRLIVGVEVRKQMVAAFHERYDIINCVPIWGAAKICLEDVIPDQSLHRVFIFHPDPWFKKRHHKRRVLTNDVLCLIHQKLKPGGRVYVSTDVSELYDDMMYVCQTYGNVDYIADDPFWTDDYLTHWSMFSDQEQRSQFFLTFQFKEAL